ncbi:hypothetical protein PtA15_3A454 [Puccinia triticina]|uniref:Uncharacterized protein n=1 Tax=Puccinia triticina TaxID=208348 RepID=A0ABY7CGM0_9BASI|nr:uncharacterized protein PtA15_3A454 [Puccinia triticina]WAQ83087.1 hypothetical protein PtA15_3A454 [Puccinia triticina]
MGIILLEDVLEALLREPIYDETDLDEHALQWINNLLAQQTSITAEPSAAKLVLLNHRKALKLLAKRLGGPLVASCKLHTSKSFYALSDNNRLSTATQICTLECNQISKFSILGGGAPEDWTNASFEEQNPERCGLRLPLYR